ncbi:hypothetical protein XELAEV_18041789mg [Xenopus laevis]|uniref:Non-specific serine/threonine protein kinase n=1 Tax=Xenopus laevis TaxID=8355 RepID=A0A974H5W3_XENLA|nr:hypothetical protein XELAEV_18041789mg [Xenopus laevis]
MGARLCSILRRHRHTETVDIKQSFGACEPQVSISLSGMKQELVRVIQKEMRIAAGAENLYRVTKDRKTKALVKEQRDISEKRVKALYSSLLKLNEEIARREAETATAAVLETASHTSINLPAEEVSAPEVQLISEPASDSSQQQHEESSEEPVPEVEEVPEEPSESDSPAEDIREEAEEEAKSVADSDQDLQQEEESGVPEDCQTEEIPLEEEAENTQELTFGSFGARDFRRIKVLGRGSFGKVLLVEYLPANIYCTLKVLKTDNIDSSEEIERILAEKRIGQLVNPHSFVVDLYATFSTKHLLFFVMEFVAGGSLKTHLARRKLFDLESAKFYAACITLGLEAIHTKNVIHRDLKPGNLLMDDGGYLKIADFGMSKTDIGYGDRTNTMVGSPAYMAPEIVKEEEYTRAVDWWALGVIVYEMLLGTRPFTGYDRDFIYDSIVEDELRYPSTLDSEALSFISQLLNKNPEERLGSTPGDAADVAEHPFFNGIVWDDIIERKMTAPFIPSLNGPEDVNYFEEDFTNLPANLTLPKGPHAEMAREIDEAFQDFDYAAF